MQLILDIEANGLENPTKVWVVVCKDIDSGDLHVFRRLSDDVSETERLRSLLCSAERAVGHNLLGYDVPVLDSLLRINVPVSKTIDTLVISKLVDYSRSGGHSLETYGERFGHLKLAFTDFSQYSQEMEDYCARDVEITALVYAHFLPIISDQEWNASIRLEHEFQRIVNALHINGFHFNTDRALSLLRNIEQELGGLDLEILSAFPPREIVVKEFTTKLTKFGTISKSSVPKSLRDQIHLYEPGKTYKQTEMVPFNPSSVKQIITVLNEAGWKPTVKTKTHIEVERELSRAKYNRSDNQVDLKDQYAKIEQLKIFGWKINEENLSTLPETAPAPARLLAKRILLESRRRTLTEWLSLVRPDGRIHGKFIGIGAWTHRMAHQNPNCANIPTGAKLHGDVMRSLWQAPRNRLLVGVDAEGIQLRIFAHYIDDPEFTRSLVEGKKDDQTDPHSLNARILGSVCNNRQTAKRFIYALLLGAGINKLAEILDVSQNATRSALDRLMDRYQGFQKLKDEIIPLDAKRGWFLGLDGRRVLIPGTDVGSRRHLCMSGYLQNGEAIVMKKACLLWHETIQEDFKMVNFVHDEWQTEVKNDINLAMKIAKKQADSLKIVGEELNLKCPLAGSYWNDDHKDYTIGKNWSITH